jgi:hypothetical protein
VSRSKAKGTSWETAICRHLADNGFPHAERRALNGTTDRGDIAGIVGWVIEAKNCQRLDLAGWIDEATLEQANAGAAHSAVWHHRRGKASPAAAYVTMTGATFLRLLREAGYGEPLSATESAQSAIVDTRVTRQASRGSQGLPATPADTYNTVGQL